MRTRETIYNTQRKAAKVTDLEVSYVYDGSRGGVQYAQIAIDSFGEIFKFELKAEDMQELVRQWERVRPIGSYKNCAIKERK